MSRRIDLLVEAGELLYGPNNWMGLLADDLAINRETLRQWVRGRREYPEGPIYDRLVDLIDLRMVALNDLRLKFLNPGDVVQLASVKNSQQP